MNMESRLKNTILSTRRYQRHLKLAFIIANEEVSNVIGDILNWCSFNLRGGGSLIYKLDSLENGFNQSLIKEHSPDFLVKVGYIPKATIEEIERKYQPFHTWDWNEIRDADSAANLTNMLSYWNRQSANLPKRECRVSAVNKGEELFLLGATLFGFLLPKQMESLEDYLKIMDVKMSKDDPVEILSHQPYGGIINLVRSLFWPIGESYDVSRCYDIVEEEREVYHSCYVIDDVSSWDNLSLFWNLRAHFGRRIFFLPIFLFHDNKDVLLNFLWDNLKDKHTLTILSNSLTNSEILESLQSIPNSNLERKEPEYNLTLKRNNESKLIQIKTKADDWSDIFGKIRTTYGKVDRVPVHFSESGGMVELPEPTLFDPHISFALYAVDFEIPFFKPSKSINLRFGLGLGSQTQISTIGLTTVVGDVHDEKFVPIRALDSIRAIKHIVSDYGFEARESSNGEMTTRFLSLLKDLHELYVLSGEDILSFLKRSNPLARNEAGKTVKAPDEDAAINWSRICEYLNISRAPYLTPRFAEKIVSWMVNRGFLKLGAKIRCGHCFNRQWIPVDQIKRTIYCSACFSELPMPLGSFHHLEWSYLLNLLLGRAIDQGFLTSLLTIYYLTYENIVTRSNEKMTYFYPGVDIYKNGNHVAELDLFVVSEGEVITGESKIGRDVTEEEMDKLISTSEAIGADVALFCTLSNFSKECIELIEKKANQAKFKVAILQGDQLLNQTLYRKVKKQSYQHGGLDKSYREIFVEDVIRNL